MFALIKNKQANKKVKNNLQSSEEEVLGAGFGRENVNTGAQKNQKESLLFKANLLKISATD